MIEKSRIVTDENNVQMFLPISKLNKSNRTVSGFATLNNIDYQNDLITSEASEKAFTIFRGNIREQHDKNTAVGKMLSFSKRDYFDEKSGSLYSGIYVTARISTGAQNTWEKVLDGTLNGFSVHGGIVKHHTEFSPELQKQIRVIDEYFLDELSLVDSPCNQLANIMAIEKSVDGSIVIKGMAADVEIENVYWCENDRVASITTDSSSECTKCNSIMVSIGWFEKTTNDERVTKLNEIISSYQELKKSKENVMEGGSYMSEQEKVEEVVDSVSKSAEETVTEVTAPEVDLETITKALEEIKNTLSKLNEDGQSKDASLSEIRNSVDGVSKGLETRLEELLSQHKNLESDFKEFKNGLEGVEKRLSTVESSAAIKKSNDIVEEEISKNKKEGFWSGAFLP